MSAALRQMASETNTLMHREAAEAPARVAEALAKNAEQVERIAERIRGMRPRAFVTCARGSSDHAATFARYVVEKHVGIVTSSAAPSIASVYDANVNLRDCFCLAISQSGASPDLLAVMRRARAAGAYTVALVNQAASPLSAVVHESLAMHAGPERSVAATKSFIASIAGVLQLTAAWRESAGFRRAVASLPDLLQRAWALDWSAALPTLADARHLYVVARGPALGIAQEAALKFKEVCGLHAEAYSAAEVLHGPIAIVSGDFPVLLLGQQDAAQAGLASLAAELAARGVPLLAAGVPSADGVQLPVIAADSLVQPLLQIQTFYRFANALAVARGLDPDRPAFLEKVTTTT